MKYARNVRKFDLCSLISDGRLTFHPYAPAWTQKLATYPNTPIDPKEVRISVVLDGKVIYDVCHEDKRVPTN